MENPFRKRATEFLRDDEAFLAIVTPEPIRYFLAERGKDGRLYDRLVLLRGTPGSGKTTLARLFEFPTFHTLLHNTNFEGHKDISAALESCDALHNGVPRILGFRLPLETGYRDFWEFEYAEDLKTNLMTALLQARAVLGWFRHLRIAGVDPAHVEVIIRPEATEVADTIGGTSGDSLREKAAQVERAIYQVMNSLIAPKETDLPREATVPYRPFDIIDQFAVPHPLVPGSQSLQLLPLAIFDDAHVLHPKQFSALEKFLLRRELRVARWMIARFDILLPQEALAAVSHDAADAASFPGVSADRESEVILLQSAGNRRTDRTRFRNMAKDMASRYLRRMPVLSERGLTILTNLLADADVSINPAALTALRKQVESLENRLDISADDRQRLESQIRDFRKANSEELVLAMLCIMMHRFSIRRGRRNPTLFDIQDDEREADIRVAANDSVYAAALFQLFHEHNRPYYCGIDDLCDASTENAEQFLQLAAELVEAVVTQVARGKPALLTPERQHALLRRRGEKIMQGWRFPHDGKVRTLVAEIARRCLQKSIEPNGAVLANAIGIPQEQFDTLADLHSELARVLQFAIAYNAITLVPHYTCKHKTWCLLELGGMALLRYGLTLKRGGFIESTSTELATFLEGPAQ
jgi:hypothetical protein